LLAASDDRWILGVTARLFALIALARPWMRIDHEKQTATERLAGVEILWMSVHEYFAWRVPGSTRQARSSEVAQRSNG
jgi:hypothetical protein